MTYNKKDCFRFCILYGFIIALVNFIGFMLPGTGNIPLQPSGNWVEWMAFMDRNEKLITTLTVIVFIIPALVCISFIRFAGDKAERRMINLPLAYSIFGSLGWVLSFILESITLAIFKINHNVEISEIIITSFMYILQEGLFIFTLAFLILDTLHRKFFFPKYYPQGKLSKISGLKNPSVNFLFVVFYISIGIFPVFFLTSTILNILKNGNIKISNAVFVLITFIVVFGIVLLIIFTHVISSPLKKFKITAREIEQGNYNVRCNVVSNDTFGDLADTFNDMIFSLDAKSKKINAIQNSIIRGMAVMVESRDNSTGGHINRTSDCVNVFVRKLRETEKYKDLSDSFCRSVVKAAPMHDLGKIAVDDEVLRKPGKFTDEEYEKMKAHSAEGARIVEQVLKEVDDFEFKQIAVNVAHYHHEKWNGTGYPEKISGEQIPLEARIMALADVFDALVSKRCYKDSFSYDKAFSIIEESLGTQFDPDLGKIFLGIKKDLIELYDQY